MHCGAQLPFVDSVPFSFPSINRSISQKTIDFDLARSAGKASESGIWLKESSIGAEESSIGAEESSIGVEESSIGAQEEGCWR